MPNLEKKTTISFPLINPDPMTVPTIARNEDIQTFIDISYCQKRKIRIIFILHLEEK